MGRYIEYIKCHSKNKDLENLIEFIYEDSKSAEWGKINCVLSKVEYVRKLVPDELFIIECNDEYGYDYQVFKGDKHYEFEDCDGDPLDSVDESLLTTKNNI